MVDALKRASAKRITVVATTCAAAVTDVAATRDVATNNMAVAAAAG